MQFYSGSFLVVTTKKDKNDSDESLKLISSSFVVGSIENVET